MAQHDDSGTIPAEPSRLARWSACASWVVDAEALAARVRNHAVAHRIGLSAVFSLDAMHDMDCADVLDFLASDSHTQIVFIALASIERPASFLSAARACVKCKPVIAWCRPPDDHDPAVYRAAIARTGFVCVDSLDSLFDASALVEAEGVRTGHWAERHRAELARIMATPPLPAPDARGLREAHARVARSVDAWCTRVSTSGGWLDGEDAGHLLDEYGVRVGPRAFASATIDPERRSDTSSSAQVRQAVLPDDAATASTRAGPSIDDTIDLSTRTDATPGDTPDRLMRIGVAIAEDALFGAFMTVAPHDGPVSTHLLPVDAALIFDTLLNGVSSGVSNGVGNGASDGVGNAVSDALARERAASVAYALESISSLRCGEARIDALSLELVCHADRWVCENARIRLVQSTRSGALSIRPYPFELEETVDWDGTDLTFRPIRPEDEPHHAGLFRAQSAEDLYLRFFNMQRQPDHERLARLVRIDYAREMAIVACSGEVQHMIIHGVSRAVTDPDNEAAEFAVAIRSDEKGHHLGRMLMERIIDYCRSRGTGRLEGIVLKENRRMLALAQDCGFERVANEDPTVWSLVLPLRGLRDPAAV